MSKQKNMPKEILVYVADKLEDGTLIYGVSANVDDIPEECHGEKIGVYILNRTDEFRVRRELK